MELGEDVPWSQRVQNLRVRALGISAQISLVFHNIAVQRPPVTVEIFNWSGVEYLLREEREDKTPLTSLFVGKDKRI